MFLKHSTVTMRYRGVSWCVCAHAHVGVCRDILCCVCVCAPARGGGKCVSVCVCVYLGGCMCGCVCKCGCGWTTIIQRYISQIVRAPSPEALLDEGNKVLKAYKERRSSGIKGRRRSGIIHGITEVLSSSKPPQEKVASTYSAESDSAISQGRSKPPSDVEDVVQIQLIPEDDIDDDRNSCGRACY